MYIPADGQLFVKNLSHNQSYNVLYMQHYVLLFIQHSWRNY